MSSRLSEVGGEEGAAFRALCRRAASDPGAADELVARYLRRGAVVAVEAHAMAHQVAHRGLPAAAALWAELAEAAAPLAFFDAPGDALAAALALAALEPARRLQATVAVCVGEVLVGPDVVVGAAAERARRIAAVVVGGVAADEATVRACPPPPGVGVFRAPQHDEALAGVGFHLLRDYRV